MIALKSSYCTFCGARSGENHPWWCPRNDDIEHDHQPPTGEQR